MASYHAFILSRSEYSWRLDDDIVGIGPITSHLLYATRGDEQLYDAACAEKATFYQFDRHRNEGDRRHFTLWRLAVDGAATIEIIGRH